MARKVDRSEFAPITDIYLSSFFNLAPISDKILLEKGNGNIELYDKIAQDDQVVSCMQQRIAGVISKEWQVKAGGTSKIDEEAADHVKSILESIKWDAVTQKMLWGNIYGKSLAEILWDVVDDKVTIAEIKVRKRDRFRFDLNGQPKIYQPFKGQYVPIPDKKFWYFSTNAYDDDSPEGIGLGHWLYWPVFFKRADFKWWILFLEKFAKPTRKGTYPAGATEDDKEQLWQALSAFGSNDKIMVPESAGLELLSANGSATADYQAMVDICNASISKIILSQTMTTDNGSSRSQSEVHQDVAESIIKSDADLICESFNNSVVKWLTEWNFPNAKLPIVYRDMSVNPDLKAEAEKDKILSDLGFPLKPEAVKDKYGDNYQLPEDEDGNQAVNLNGIQVQSLTNLISQAEINGWSPELVEATLSVAFPAIDKEDIRTIASALKKPDKESPSPSPSIENIGELFSEDIEFQEFEAKQKQCKKGLACGNSCIAKEKTCNSRLTDKQKTTKSKTKQSKSDGDKNKAKSDKKDQFDTGFVGDLPVDLINADPKRFQYKIIGEHTKSGEVGSLSGVQKYDPNLSGIVQVWKDPSDKNLYVINGHNRLALAKRSNAEKITARIIDAPDAATARGIGALTNIAEGRGTPLDAAKFFRDSGLTLADLKTKGIPLKEKIATDGLGIAALEHSLFNKVLDGEITESRAALIGNSGLSASQQLDLYKLSESKVKKGKLSDDAFNELIETVKASEVKTASLFDLFGTSQVEQSNAIERASLTASIKRQMARDKKLFGLVAKTKAAQDLARAGNKINQEESAKVSQDASSLLGIFDQLKNQGGGISSVLNKYSSKVASGDLSSSKAQSEAYKEIRELIKSGKL